MTTTESTPTNSGPALTRRALLGRMGVLAGATAIGPALLAACGSDDDSVDSGGGGGSSKALWFENWPAYIDEETVALFAKESGLDFNYTEGFNDNAAWFAKNQRLLADKKSVGPDIVAPTYWMVARLINLGWVQELPLDAIPNAANLVPSLQKPGWDPTGAFSLPWQSGMTGIAYNRSVTGRDLTSMADIFDPELKGKIGMLTEWRDTVGLTMLLLGADPSTATLASAGPALDKIEEAAKSGQIRQFTGNDYMDDLASGNFAACVGWSGDISQLALDNPDVRFAIPEEGGMQWSDTMILPAGAENVDNAATWMNYVYDPENAARITAYVGYNPPVVGVQEILAAGSDEEKALAESPLLFPDEATLARLHVFASLDEDAESGFEERFATIIGA
ncbi:MAG: spermidine/putrescine ABC transporter substrate-binding protein [Acidimicrobiales bacterium]